MTVLPLLPKPFLTLTAVTISVLVSCTSVDERPSADHGSIELDDSLQFSQTLDRIVPSFIEDYGLAGVGIAVIREGSIVWEEYYGQQAPDVRLSKTSVFNVASVAKTLTAETLMSLDARGVIDLDEPIVEYVRHPDLSSDVRYSQLTARLLLSHRGGLLNWAYLYDDGKLSFDHDPATRTSYSGAGVELAARYAEARTGKPFSQLVEEEVFRPLSMSEVSLGLVPEWAEGRMNRPMNAAGHWTSIEETNPGLASGIANSAADDLVITVPEFAKVVAALASGAEELGGQWSDRTDVLGTLNQDPVYACPDLDWLRCPDAYGHAVGWHSFQYGDHTVISHSGSDEGENAFVYVSPDTRSGAVIFINGANGWPTMTRIIEAIGDEPDLADYYRGLIEVRMNIPMPPLDAVSK